MISYKIEISLNDVIQNGKPNGLKALTKINGLVLTNTWKYLIRLGFQLFNYGDTIYNCR